MIYIFGGGLVFCASVFVLQVASLYLPRHIGLMSGVPTDAPALAVNTLAGSGLQAIINGTQVYI
jgi:acetyl-CoA acyltransferase 2